MRIDGDIQRTFRVQRSVLGTEHPLGELGVIGHLPGPGTGSIAQRLSIIIAIGILVIAHARTKFKAQAVNRTVQDLTTITRG